MRRSDRTRVSSSSWLNGFGMKSSAPASIALRLLLRDARRDHDHRQHRRVVVLPQPAADRVAVEPGHHRRRAGPGRAAPSATSSSAAGRRGGDDLVAAAATSTASSRRTFSRRCRRRRGSSGARRSRVTSVAVAPARSRAAPRRRPASTGSRRSRPRGTRSRSPCIACAVRASTGIFAVRSSPRSSRERLDAVHAGQLDVHQHERRHVLAASASAVLARLASSERVSASPAARPGRASCSSRCPRRRG